MSRLTLALMCASAFLVSASLSYRVTAAIEEPQYAWLHGFDARGRSFSLGALRGQVVALTFIARDTREEGTDINDDLGRLAEAGKMTLVSVINLEDVPHFAHGTALHKMAAADRPGVVHLVDDEGRLKQSFGVNPKERVTILVLDREGALRGRFEGEAGLPAALKLVQQLKQS